MAVYGIIGFPLVQSLSPQLHNPAFRFITREDTYQKFEIDPAAFDDRIGQLLKDPQSQGFNITIPFKEQILPYCSRLSPEAGRIGAVNTLARDEDGRWVGHNSDWFGFITPLDQHQNLLKKVLIAGAGGSARAVVYALLRRQNIQKIHILNRNVRRAEMIIQAFSDHAEVELSCHYHPLDGSEFKSKEFDLVVNTTPLGSVKEKNSLAIFPTRLNPGAVCYDLIYNPAKTLFLQKAVQENTGISVINGWPMLVWQASQSFKIWTGGAFPGQWLNQLLPDGNQSFSSSVLSV